MRAASSSRVAGPLQGASEIQWFHRPVLSSRCGSCSILAFLVSSFSRRLLRRHWLTASLSPVAVLIFTVIDSARLLHATVSGHLYKALTNRDCSCRRLPSAMVCNSRRSSLQASLGCDSSSPSGSNRSESSTSGGRRVCLRSQDHLRRALLRMCRPRNQTGSPSSAPKTGEKKDRATIDLSNGVFWSSCRTGPSVVE